MNTQNAKSILCSYPMVLKVDVEGLKKLRDEHNIIFAEETIKFQDKVMAAYGIPNFNINSSAQKKVLLEKLHIDTSRGAGKDVYLRYKDQYPILAEMEKLGEMEHLRRCLCGSKKGGDSIFEDFYQENGEWFFRPEVVMTDGRLYQNKLYAMPYAMRKFLLPKKGNKFLYLDLHAAELTLLAHMSGDPQLLEDCLSGQVWPIWFEKLGIDKSKKMDLKRAIYACVYSLSDVAIPYSIGKRFFRMFFERYPQLDNWLKQRVADTRISGQNSCWDGQSCTYNLSEYNVTYKILNHPIQFGLSNYVQQLAALLATKYSAELTLDAINFDSIWVEGIEDIEDLKSKIDACMAEIGIRFVVKYSEGKNFAEAQGK